MKFFVLLYYAGYTMPIPVDNNIATHTCGGKGKGRVETGGGGIYPQIVFCWHFPEIGGRRSVSSRHIMWRYSRLKIFPGSNQLCSMSGMTSDCLLFPMFQYPAGMFSVFLPNVPCYMCTCLQHAVIITI